MAQGNPLLVLSLVFTLISFSRGHPPICKNNAGQTVACAELPFDKYGLPQNKPYYIPASPAHNKPCHNVEGVEVPCSQLEFDSEGKPIVDFARVAWTGNITQKDSNIKGRSQGVLQCPTTGGRTCVFPFKWGSSTYTSCDLNDASYNWCATSLTADGEYDDWDYCDPALCSRKVVNTGLTNIDDDIVLSWLNHFRKLHYANQISELDLDLTREAIKAGRDNCNCLRTSQGVNHHPCGPGVKTGKHAALGECKFDKCGSREAAIVADLKWYHETEADVYCQQKFYRNPPSDQIGIGHFTAMVWKGATKYGLWAYKCPKRESWIVAMSPNTYNILGQFGRNVGRPKSCSHAVEASFSGPGLSSGSVICGNHRATSCSECTKDAPKLNPWSWCNGNCEWVRNTCRKRN